MSQMRQFHHFPMINVKLLHLDMADCIYLCVTIFYLLPRTDYLLNPLGGGIVRNIE